MSWVFSGKSKKVLQSLKLLGLHSIALKDAKHGSMTTVFLQVTFAGGWGGSGEGRTQCIQGMGSWFQSLVIYPEEQTVILSSLEPSLFWGPAILS